MSWNNYIERKKLNRRIAKQEREYRQLGMPEKAIKEILELDRKQHRKNRIYRMHTQPLEEPSFSDDSCDESDNALLLRYAEQFSASQDILADHSRYWWIEEIENPVLCEKLKRLSKADIELLTLYVYDQKTMEEIASILHCTKVNIFKKIERIRKSLA